jgi:hypothetical protein
MRTVAHAFPATLKGENEGLKPVVLSMQKIFGCWCKNKGNARIAIPGYG